MEILDKDIWVKIITHTHSHIYIQQSKGQEQIICSKSCLLYVCNQSGHITNQGCGNSGLGIEKSANQIIKSTSFQIY